MFPLMRRSAPTLSSVFLVLAFLGLYTPNLFAENEHDHFYHTYAENEKYIKFVKNNGQWDDFIRYRADIVGGTLYLEDGSFGYKLIDNSDLHHRFYEAVYDTVNPLKVDGHFFKVNFLNANPLPEMAPSDKYDEYHNYFIGNDPSKWAPEVPLYAEVRYEELYPGIDLQVYGKRMSIKYDLILQPGADPNLIQFEYDGVDDLQIIDGQLHVKTSVQNVVEEKPFAYQIINGKHVEMPCRYKLEGNILSFEFPAGYDTERELIIDPSVVFSTFTGSFSDNWGYTATFGPDGSLFAGGVCFGTGYPTTTGAFQEVWAGGVTVGAGLSGPLDISITRFTPDGTAMLWATYLGGASNEQPHSMIANDAGDLYVYGRTYSNDYPVSAAAYDPTSNGQADICVTKLTSNGASIIGSTYLGGADDDGENVTFAFTPSSLKYNYGDDARGEIMNDGADNCYIASCSQSSDFPTTAGAFQTTKGTQQDGVICKMNSDLSALTWSSYLGGTGNDACFSVKVNNAGEIYLAGGTESADFPTSASAVQPVYAGAIDGYIFKLDATGSSMIASTFTGTSVYDQVYFVELDSNSNPYVVGQTLGAFPVTAGAYSETDGRHFIQRYNTNLTNLEMSTVFGSGGSGIDISPTAFLVDVCGFIYVSGWGSQISSYAVVGNTNGLTVTADAYQSMTDGDDLYLVVFQPDAAGIEYATYYGGTFSHEHVDGGTSRFNKDLQVYQAVCAGCGGNDDFPIEPSPGAYSPFNLSSNCNLGAFKLQFDPQFIVSSFNSNVIAGCAPYTVDFENTSSAGDGYIWFFGDGDSDTIFEPSHVYVVPDTYTVTLVVFDSSSCNFTDTTEHTIIIFDQPVAASSNDTSSCNGNATPLFATGGDTYLWTPALGLSDPTIANPIANPPFTTTYTVYVSNAGGCLDSTEVTVTVTSFEAEAGMADPFCEGTGGTQLSGSATGGTGPFFYEWWCDSSITNCGLDSIF